MNAIDPSDDAALLRMALDDAYAALAASQAREEALRRELAAVDETIARRPAVAGAPNRLVAIERAFRAAQKAEDDMIAWRAAAQSFTPGGSEFMSPQAVREFVRTERDERHQRFVSMTKAKARERERADAWERWAETLFSDFEGVTDNAADPSRLHDWTWIEEHRPPPNRAALAEPTP